MIGMKRLRKESVVVYNRFQNLHHDIPIPIQYLLEGYQENKPKPELPIKWTENLVICRRAKSQCIMSGSCPLEPDTSIHLVRRVHGVSLRYVEYLSIPYA